MPTTPPIQVLLIEDDSDDALITQRLLTAAYGAGVVTEHIAGAAEGLAAMREGRHDVALLDYRLGTTSGLDLLKQSCDSGRCRLPVILLTGMSDRDTDVAAMAAGAADYLIKGQITSAVLERAIRYARERHRAHEVLEIRVAERTAELARARDEAERASRVKGEFLSRMSHELRTPMHAIMGFAQLLEMDELSQEQRGSVDQILRASGRLLGLIDEVLSISNFQSRSPGESQTPVSLGEVLSMAREQHAWAAEEAGVALSPVPQSARACTVWGDAGQLVKAFSHIIGNAVKFNRPGGTALLSCQSAGAEHVCVEIEDSGPGIATEDVGKLFTPFERLDAEKSGIEGAGLGLAVSRWIIEAMGGTLTVESVPGQGSTFAVTLPLLSSAGAVNAGGSGLE